MSSCRLAHTLRLPRCVGMSATPGWVVCMIAAM
nr:MAG TPA: hypothetical protein [Caudoviricetes sp.]